MDPTANITNNAQGNPLTTKSRVLETGAAVGQVSNPLDNNEISKTAVDGISGFYTRKTNLCSP